MKKPANTKLLNHIAKEMQRTNQDEMLADNLWDIIDARSQSEHEKNVLALYHMGKTNLNKFLKQALLKSIPNDFPSVFMDIERDAKELIEQQEYELREQKEMEREEAEWARLDAIDNAKKKALQAKNKAFVATLSKDQKKIWKELKYTYQY